MFLFWDKVYIKRYKDNNYSGQIGSDLYDKIPGRFVGFAWDVGHTLTFRVLTDDTQELAPRSQLMLADDPENNLNLKEPLPNRPNIITMKRETGDPEKDAQVVLPTIDSIRAPFAEDAEDIAKHRAESKTDKVEVPLVEESASTRAQQTDQQVQVETVESEEAERGINDDAEELFPSKEKSKPAPTQSSKKKPPPRRMRKTMKTTIDHRWIIHHCEIERMLSGSKLKNKIFRHTYGNRRKGSHST